MKDKRISLRFLADNERDMEAWKMLEEMAQKKNASKNSIAIELILSGQAKLDPDDALANSFYRWREALRRSPSEERLGF